MNNFFYFVLFFLLNNYSESSEFENPKKETYLAEDIDNILVENKFNKTLLTLSFKNLDKSFLKNNLIIEYKKDKNNDYILKIKVSLKESFMTFQIDKNKVGYSEEFKDPEREKNKNKIIPMKLDLTDVKSIPKYQEQYKNFERKKNMIFPIKIDLSNIKEIKIENNKIIIELPKLGFFKRFFNYFYKNDNKAENIKIKY